MVEESYSSDMGTAKIISFIEDKTTQNNRAEQIFGILAANDKTIRHSSIFRDNYNYQHNDYMAS